MKIAIDPGHGMSNRSKNVFDSGATHTENTTEFREADIALKYGLTLKDVFRSRGHDVFMTRDDNSDHAPVGERAGNAEDAGADVFISLHLNDSDDDAAHGLEVLFRGEDDKPLAQSLLDSLIKVTGFRDRGIIRRTDLAVLKFNGKAVLIELGFIANDGDRESLLNPATRASICEALANVIVGPAAEIESSGGTSEIHTLRDHTALPQAKVNPPTGDTLTVREQPRQSATAIGQLNAGTIITIYASSGIWRRISADSEKWVSSKFLVPLEVQVVAQDSNVAPIIQIAANSEIAGFNWPGHGRAHIGYTKGMALAYGRAYCKLLGNDPLALEMAKASSASSQTDGITRYRTRFHEIGLDLPGAGVEMLRRVFVLILGLGIRESDGAWNEGLYKPDNNIQHDTAEAGIFQTSYNIIGNHALSRQLYESYRGKEDRWLPVFKEEVPQNSAGLINWGNGPGVEFQQLSKFSPTFAAEMAALRVRSKCTHWAPIRDLEASVQVAADRMFLEVQDAIDASGSCSLLL